MVDLAAKLGGYDVGTSRKQNIEHKEGCGFELEVSSCGALARENNDEWCSHNDEEADDLLQRNLFVKEGPAADQIDDRCELKIDGGRGGFFGTKAEIVRNDSERINCASDEKNNYLPKRQHGRLSDGKNNKGKKDNIETIYPLHALRGFTLIKLVGNVVVKKH